MKKWFIVLFVLLLFVNYTAGFAQSNPGYSGEISDDEWNWDTYDPSLYIPPMPETDYRYSPNMVTSENFPQYVLPPAVSGEAPSWNIPENVKSTEMYVGSGGSYRTVSDAVKHIPVDAGNVTIYLGSDTIEPQNDISIPVDRNITSLRIASDNGSWRTMRPENEKVSVWVFCNGIPFIIDKNVSLAGKSMIMGGSEADRERNVQTSASTIIINGSAHWVYAGGQSDYAKQLSTVGDALVIVNGSVDRVFAGGRSITGETLVHYSTVVVNGSANEIYCGGYTEYNYSKATVGKANMIILGWYNIYGLGRGSGDSVLLDPAGCY